MNKDQARARLTKLRAAIDTYRYQFHVLDKTDISESALDSLKHELTLLEEQYPDLITPYSPSQRVAGKPLDQFKKVRHSSQMLSLQDVFSPEELQAWIDRTAKLIPDEKFTYFAEPKLDGLAVSLIYTNGLLEIGATRGDGAVGEDVTQNLKTMESIPLRLVPQSSNRISGAVVQKAMHGIIEVRGEVVISRRNFAALNKTQAKNSQPLFANPRNLAAGSIRQLDPKLALARTLDFVAYQVIGDIGISTHEQEHILLDVFGFKTMSTEKCLNMLEIIHFLHDLEKKRQKLAFQTDGAVININERALWSRLGVVGKAPRYIVAYKFAAEEVTTKVVAIEVQVGRTGAITPVAIMEPVKVAGTTVSRATLHNEDEIKRKDVRVGDTVVIRKAGDIIPEVVKVLSELRQGKEKSWRMPTKCPLCQSDIVRAVGEAVARCSNAQCFGQEKERIRHFVGRAAFDIDGAGEAVIDQMLEKQVIRDAADLFNVQVGDIAVLDRFAQKSAQNLFDAIAAGKTVDLHRFLYALGIRHVGEQMAYNLAQFVASRTDNKKSLMDVLNIWKVLEAQTKEELEKIPDIGSVVAESIFTYVHSQTSNSLIHKLHAAGIRLTMPKRHSLALEGKTFVFTGQLQSLTREDAEARVRELGGSASSSVSQNTDYVVVGTDPGSKAEKARELGVMVLQESEAKKLLGLK